MGSDLSDGVGRLDVVELVELGLLLFPALLPLLALRFLLRMTSQIIQKTITKTMASKSQTGQTTTSFSLTDSVPANLTVCLTLKMPILGAPSLQV